MASSKLPVVNGSEPLEIRRRDIQGLRAIAVIMVVLFHSGLPVYGGFLGVDVFFVISGYVITLMLIREWNTNNFISLRRFYWRRLKRLFPAFAIMLGTTLTFSILFLSPLGNQKNVFETALGTLLVSANFVIARTTGNYFDSDAKINPLLHTWSLAVEEQFYLVFPLLLIGGLVLCRKNSRSYINPKSIILFSITISVILSLSMSLGKISFYGANTILGFYSPITRAWEFATGGLVAILVAKKRQASLKSANPIQFFGAFFLVLSALAISENSEFLGAWTLLPVIGTGLLLYGGDRGNSFVHRLLTSRPLVYVGDWSYSIYLWHWPFIVFSSVLFPYSLPATIGAVILSLVPALLSYYFIEDPIRRLDVSRFRNSLVKIAVICIFPLFCLSVFGVGLMNQWWVSWPQSIKPQEQRIAFMNCTDQLFDPTRCTFGKNSSEEKILLVGDSQAYAFTEGVIQAATSLGLSAVVSSRSGCPLSSLDTTGDKPLNCPAWQKEILDYIMDSKPKVVLIANRSSGYTNEGWRTMIKHSGEIATNKVSLYESGLSRVVDKITQVGIPIIVLQNIPEPNFKTFQPTLLHKFLPNLRRFDFDASKTLSLRAPVAAAEHSITNKYPKSFLFDPSNVLCNGTKCKAIKDSKSLFIDDWHLSEEGSLLLAPSLRKTILKAIQEQ